jgi:hypothetical protein
LRSDLKACRFSDKLPKALSIEKYSSPSAGAKSHKWHYSGGPDRQDRPSGGPQPGPLPAGRARHAQAHRPQLWLGVNNRGPLTATGIYQIVARRGRQCGVTVYPHRFRHHFSHTWLDRGGAERDLMELNGWTSPQMLARYGASARGARARRSYDRIMDDTT